MADEDGEGGVLDFTGYGLKKFDIPEGLHPNGLILDQNSISKIENVEHLQDLQQLSLASNHLVRMVGVSSFIHLTVLRLSNNSIVNIEGLTDLVYLSWLDLSGNSIKVIENLKHNARLRHLDLSDNNIAVFGELSPLSILKTLLLHGNIISSLKPIPACIPPSVRVLSLESNDLCDLNEMCYLASLPDLDQLSLANNPCVLMTALTQYPSIQATNAVHHVFGLM
ncbi:centrosomal protein of 97 kDa-like [Haliotis cracherodii]|uniref:centrosomal protein of 97 kDa-like n=1 Tax=Haliotis cracherodii TaxID=6455 RepID=UPI0039EBBE0F